MTPEWLDRDRYPFESRFFDSGAGRVHYVDEGSGRPVVFLHGNPTWSFMYRRAIRALAPTYRCIAPDYPGFGLSAAPRDFSYRPRDHARVVRALLESLDLDGVVLVCHDWGGPIGFEYATRNPGRIAGLVVIDTFAWPLSGWRVRAFSALVGGPIGRLLCTRYDLFARHLLPLAFADRSRLTPEIHEHYLAPFADVGGRRGTWTFPRELTGSSGWLADVWGRRGALAGVPGLVLWGEADPVFGRRERDRWESFLPGARTVALDDVGHYVPEEAPDALVDALRGFLAGL